MNTSPSRSTFQPTSVPNVATPPDQVSPQQSRQQQMADSIVALIRERDSASFVEIINRLTELGFEPRGDTVIRIGAASNVVLWADISKVLAHAIMDLLARKAVSLHLCCVPCYMRDGGFLNLPVATEAPPAGGFKRPHWLPVVFREILPEVEPIPRTKT